VDVSRVSRQFRGWFRVVKILVLVNCIRLVVFGMAGTIIEDRGEVLRAFDTALGKHGIVCSGDELAEWKGASKREVIRHSVARELAQRSRADERVETIYAEFRRVLESHYQNEGVIPVAGAEETFAWLGRHGIQTATTTGFYREVKDLILKKAGWRHMFAANI
jgi:beta-phosphoglucomutase-like phosphatase (HAD superfamily)